VEILGIVKQKGYRREQEGKPNDTAMIAYVFMPRRTGPLQKKEVRRDKRSKRTEVRKEKKRNTLGALNSCQKELKGALKEKMEPQGGGGEAFVR